jgi:hypothetical protein
MKMRPFCFFRDYGGLYSATGFGYTGSRRGGAASEKEKVTEAAEKRQKGEKTA